MSSGWNYPRNSSSILSQYPEPVVGIALGMILFKEQLRAM
jgi:hypothetical protein